MLRKLRRPSGSTAIALVALFVSLGGVGYASGANTMFAQKASVAKNADKVDGFHAAKAPKANTLLALNRSRKFPASVLPLKAGPRGPAGPPGSAGPQGPAGAPGSAIAYANVNWDGSVVTGPATKNISSSNIYYSNQGSAFCFHDLPFNVGGISATGDAHSNYLQIVMAATKAADPGEFSGNNSLCGEVNNAQAAVQVWMLSGGFWTAGKDTFSVAFF